MGHPPREVNELGQFQCPPPKGCGEWFFIDGFFKNSRTKYGISTYCRECHVRNQRRAEKRQEAKTPPRPEGVPEEAIWLAGYGWVLPIGPGPEWTGETKLHARDREVLNEPTPETDRPAVQRALNEYRKMDDASLLRAAGAAHLDDTPEDRYSPAQRALVAELKKRFS